MAPLADPFVPQLYRVGRVRRELADTVTLELAPLSGPRPAFEPGQFNMLYVFGVGEVAISMSGDVHVEALAPALQLVAVEHVRRIAAADENSNAP